MNDRMKPGNRFREALIEENPLQVVGVVNAYSALLARRCGFRALYISGGGVAASSLGVPDLGITTLDDVLIDVRRVTDAVDLPVLVDVDTGFGSAFNIARTVRSMIKAGAAAVHIEDQVQAKRCGHRPGKMLVSQAEMVDRIKAAVDARTEDSLVLMARTDALAVEGLSSAIERAQAYVSAGADMLFPEAVQDLATYQAFARAVPVPVLANLTEFGLAPSFTLEELADAGVSLALYPLTAFRMMSAAALRAYQTLRRDGGQESMLTQMQTRAELYDVLGYQAFEHKLDELFAKEKTE